MSRERKKINYENGVAIKRGIKREEANGTKLVYPNNLNNDKSLLTSNRVKSNPNGGFNIHMKILTPLENLNWKKLEYTNGAIQMLKNQFERLHKERPHTDFSVEYVNGSGRPLKPSQEFEKYSTLVRQILVERNNKTGKVVKMYLTDFDIQNTNKNNKTRIMLEKKVVEQFKAFITNKNKRSSNGSTSRQLFVNSPVKRRINNTPPQSPRRRLLF